MTLVYDPTTFNPDSIDLGQTTPFALDSLFVQGGGNICAGLDVNGLVFTIENCDSVDSCSFNLGELARDTTSSDCVGENGGMLKAIVENEPVLPNGYQVTYLLAYGTGNNRVIEQISDTASFNIDAAGRYRILTLVYNPATFNPDSIELGVISPFDLDESFVQGGGDICAGLDVNGLVFTVEDCNNGGGNGECDSTDVGKLMIIGNDVRCFEGDSINVKLQFTHAPTVPSGYETAILVTLGDNMQVAKILDGLSFTADSVALYRFQVLVYDPQTFNLNSINLGSTTAADINAQLVQGGGSICAALDTNGIVLDIRDCDVNVNCATDVNTGSLYAEADGACLDQDYQTTLTAQVDVPPMVPTGYQVKYLLTSGNDKVIRAFDDEPTFTVDQVGQFRIHVLVYDPATLDLDNINLNVTTIDSLNAMLLQGGGDICAALDVSGLRFYTRDCSCGADAGHLYYTRAGGRSLCLSESGLAFLAGNTQTRPVVPLGFNRVYLLTSGDGMVIEKIANIPVFGVRETGVYRLHTLIYDPNTLDLNSIQLGVTRATEIIQLLRQSGGDICAALEFPGLKFTVKDCSTEGGAPGIVAYPNPATNQVSINLPQQREVQQVTIEMVDINGNIAKRWQRDGVNTNVNLDINDLQPGMYYIRVLYDQEFVKELSLMKVR